MPGIDLGRIGASLNVSDAETYLGDAAELEKLGYSTIWISGGQLDTLERISAVVNATSSAKVGTAIISPDVYGPDEVTSTYAGIEAAHPGRFVVGLGGQQRAANHLAGLNNLVDRLDNANPPVPAKRRILAALGPRKLDLARDRFAGAITLLVTPDFTAGARKRLGQDATLVVEEFVILETDASRAREIARGPLGFLATVTGYANNLRRMGFTDDEVTGLSDRLVDAVVAWGSADAVVARLEQHLDVGADHMVINALGGDGLAAERELAARLIG